MDEWRIGWFSAGFSSPVGYSGFFSVKLVEEIVLGVYWFAEGVFCLMVGDILLIWKDSTILLRYGRSLSTRWYRKSLILMAAWERIKERMRIRIPPQISNSKGSNPLLVNIVVSTPKM